MMNDKVTYGHRHFGGRFEPILSVWAQGVEHNGNMYQWSDIKKIERFDFLLASLFFYQAPLAYLRLSDGTRIKIRGRVLQQEGARSKVAFVRASTEAYRDLIKMIETKTAK